jgi:hypothetical protein
MPSRTEYILRSAATIKSARTSPQRCPMCAEFAKDCTIMWSSKTIAFRKKRI